MTIALPFDAELTLHVDLTAEDRAQAVELLRSTYWNASVDPARLARALENATCAIGARTRDGQLVGYARAVSDHAKYAWLYDVIVAPAYRGRGLGLAIVKTLLDQPSVRDAATVLLKTRDMQKLYAKLGFVDVRDLPPKGYTSTEMALVRR